MGQSSSSSSSKSQNRETPSNPTVYHQDHSTGSKASALAPWLGPAKPPSQDPTPEGLLNIMYNGSFMKQILTSFSSQLKVDEKKLIILDLPDLKSGGQKTADFKLLNELPDIKDRQLKESVEKLWEKLRPGKEVLVIFHMHPHMTFKIYSLEES
jgi:hypothetical protein